jgi:serine/threonine-protein kinase PknG
VSGPPTGCAQPGCAGTIEDGYCDLCGLAPARRATGARPGAAGAAGDAATRTRRRPVQPARRGEPARARAAVRTQLGAGLVEIAPVAPRDPLDAVMAAPAVAEQRRFCSRCSSPVGRARDGAPGRMEGFCPRCGSGFSFAPRLRAGDLAGDQYEVVGCLAHGGLGWVYLARDHNVADRWVVLKGLLNAGDEEAMAAALAERLFLAEVEHPNIVKIINFVEHDGAGYIVMEYVGGMSLRELLEARRDATSGVAPVAEAIAYVLEILPALGYLHRSGLLFCDLKLDNVILTNDTLKLIDLGGVYRIGDTTSPVFATAGYHAPEIDSAGPSVASDLFTVARTLAALCLRFEGFRTTRRFTLPPQREIALLERYDSLYRLLCKATAPDPDDRFQSAAEMAEQLHGVLREVVADKWRRAAPARSTLFTADLPARPDRPVEPDGRSLPALRVATDDPAAGYLATLAATRPQELVAVLRRAPERTIEVQLRLARALIDAEDCDATDQLLAAVQRSDPWEWRAHWYRGVAELARQRPLFAHASFEVVYHAIPGELAPKLALGLSAELAGDAAAAAGWYEIVSRTDPTYTTATFGLARCRLAYGDHGGALEAYGRVPESSSAHEQAQAAGVRCLLGGEPAVADFAAAGAAIDALALDGEQRALLTAELLRAALALVTSDRAAEDRAVTLAGHGLVEHELRRGLERTYRSLAAMARTASERVRLVDEANRVRPKTWT